MVEELFRALVRVEYYDSTPTLLCSDSDELGRCFVMLQQTAVRDGRLSLCLSSDGLDWDVASFRDSQEIAWSLGRIYEILVLRDQYCYAVLVDDECVLEVASHQHVKVHVDNLIRSVYFQKSDHISFCLIDCSVGDVVNSFLRFEEHLVSCLKDAGCSTFRDLYKCPPKDYRDLLKHKTKELLLDSLMTPERLHRLWLDSLIADGWSYGEKFSNEVKQHPLLLHYDELSGDVKLKDVLFCSLVKSFSID